MCGASQLGLDRTQVHAADGYVGVFIGWINTGVSKQQQRLVERGGVPTKIHGPDSRPAPGVEDSLQRFVRPGRRHEQLAVLGEDADVMLEV